MKKIFTILFLLVSVVSFSQKVGIGTTTPNMLFHINSPADTALLQLDNNTALDNNTNVGMYFKNGTWFTGAVKTTGTGTNVARLGFYTYASSLQSGLRERLSILDNGNVGINNNNPQATLDVNGTIKISGGTPDNGKVLTASGTDGTASWANSPSYNTGFEVGANGSTTIAGGGFTSTIPFNSTVDAYGFDDGSNINNTTNAYVVPSAGVYQFNVSIGLSTGNATGSGLIALTISKNGFNTNLPSFTQSLVNGQLLPATINGSVTVKCAAGDNILVRVYNSTGGTITVDAGNSTKFSGARLY